MLQSTMKTSCALLPCPTRRREVLVVPLRGDHLPLLQLAATPLPAGNLASTGLMGLWPYGDAGVSRGTPVRASTSS